MALSTDSTPDPDGHAEAHETYVEVAETVPHPPGPHPVDQPTNLSVLNENSPVTNTDDELGGAQPGVAGSEVAPDAPKDETIPAATDAKK